MTFTNNNLKFSTLTTRALLLNAGLCTAFCFQRSCPGLFFCNIAGLCCLDTILFISHSLLVLHLTPVWNPACCCDAIGKLVIKPEHNLAAQAWVHWKDRKGQGTQPCGGTVLRIIGIDVLWPILTDFGPSHGSRFRKSTEILIPDAKLVDLSSLRSLIYRYRVNIGSILTLYWKCWHCPNWGRLTRVQQDLRQPRKLMWKAAQMKFNPG